jgi:hypothetical protein
MGGWDTLYHTVEGGIHASRAISRMDAPGLSQRNVEIRASIARLTDRPPESRVVTSRGVQLTAWMVLETAEHNRARSQTRQQDGYGFGMVTDLRCEHVRQDPVGSFSDWHS